MFQNILVPTDLTPRDAKALEVALTLCADENGRVTLVHVIETIDNADGDEFQPFYDRLEQRAGAEMLEIIGRMESGEGNIHTRILFGKRVREIVRFADENEVDLIVLSSHRIERTEPAEGWATISYRVAILAHCPVLMVK
jgi:universal stress protein A